jgi:hypothetical protein
MSVDGIDGPAGPRLDAVKGLYTPPQARCSGAAIRAANPSGRGSSRRLLAARDGTS